MTPRIWPTQVEFQDALQNPGVCFADPELRDAVAADLTPFGLPAPITGQFANVYRFRRPDGSLRAVRVFIGPAPDRARRYAAIAARLAASGSLPSSFFVPTAYQSEGIRVRNVPFPLVKMDWIEGPTLNAFIDTHLYDTVSLIALTDEFRRLMREMSAARIAHGDLQHGNLLVEDARGADGSAAKTLRVVDYDGLWLPEIDGMASSEMGHPSFQHPRRKARDYGPDMDHFSALVIYTALRVLMVAPNVWFRLNNGDNILFRREDFRDPRESVAFRVLRESLLRLPEERRLVDTLQQACSEPRSRIPDLDTIIDGLHLVSG